VSFKVLVIPEDHTHNGAILKPLVQAVLADAGKLAADVRVLDNPRVQGFEQAVAAIKGALVDRYRWMDLWLFMPDADKAKPAAMTALEAATATQGVRLMCCAAEPELEIFASAAYRAEIPGGWAQARRHARFKEVIFPPLLERHGDPRRPSGGRDLMIGAALANLPLLYQLCPEIKTLRDRIAAHLQETAP
jgi:hypothetical protein